MIDTVKGKPMFPEGVFVTSHCFFDPDTPKQVANAKWDGAEYRYVLQDGGGVQDYGYIAKDLTEWRP